MTLLCDNMKKDEIEMRKNTKILSALILTLTLLMVTPVVAQPFETVGDANASWTTDESHSGCQSARLYVKDGVTDWAQVDIEVDIAIEDISELKFWEKIDLLGASGWDVNVILGVDTNENGDFDADIAAWHQGPTMHTAAPLAGDAFVELDGWGGMTSGTFTPPITWGPLSADVDWTMVNAYDGVTYGWWTHVASGGDGPAGLNDFAYFGTMTGGPFGPVSDPASFQAFLDGPNDNSRIDVGDRVKLVKFVLGGSGMWQDEIAYVDEVTINGVLYDLGDEGLQQFSCIQKSDDVAVIVGGTSEIDLWRKPTGTVFAQFIDATAAAGLWFLCDDGILYWDIDDTAVNQADGEPLVGGHLIMSGGPIVNGPVKYYEDNKIAPVYFKGVGSKVAFFDSTTDTQVVGAELLTSELGPQKDMFVVELVEVPNAQNNLKRGSTAETWEILGDVDAKITKTHEDGSVKFVIEILETAAHYGTGIAFATSLSNPAFQVWYREYEEPKGFFYQDWTGTGWNGWGGAIIPLSSKTGFSGEGSFDNNVFTIIVPESELGGCGETFYFAIQVRTLSINSFPDGWGWSSPVSEYASQFIRPCPRLMLTIYGFGGRGTLAGAIYFKTTILPNLDDYTEDYYIVQWDDTNTNGHPDVPSTDTYTPIYPIP